MPSRYTLTTCLILGSFALMASFASAQTQPPAAPPFPSDAAIRSMLAERVDTHRQTLGVIVGLSDDAGHRFVTYGVRTPGYPRPLDQDAVFEIGSITKVFTSLLLADAVRRGEVALDDPIGKHLPPDVKTPTRNGRAITLVDLATHTSGLPSLPPNFSPKDSLDPYADYTVEQLYEFLSTYELTRDIGSRAEYSNVGVGLLGHILARRAGTDYASLVRTRILDPLGMKDTAIALSEAQQARLVPGHNAQLAPTPPWRLDTLAGAGALRSTAADMLRFLDAASGRVESPLRPLFEATLAVRRPSGVIGLEIALGWHVLGSGNSQIVWHNGGTGGYRTWAGYDPATKRAVVVLANTFSAAGPDDIGRHLLNPALPLLTTFPAAPAARKETSLTPEVLDRYVGRYQLGPAVIVTVTRDENRLFAQLTGQGRVELFAEDERQFFLKIVDAQVAFETDPQGKAIALVLHQNGIGNRAPRIEGDAIAPTAVALTPEVVDRYVGRYQFAPGATITIRRDGAQTFAQITGQPGIEIFPESDTRFFYKVVNATLTFEPGPDGRAAAVVLRQNGVEQRAARVELPTVITLDPAVLDRYAGRYELAPGIFMRIIRQGEGLIAEPTGQKGLALYPSSPTTFFIKEVDATVTFELDGSGAPTAIVVRQNGKDQRAARVDP